MKRFRIIHPLILTYNKFEDISICKLIQLLILNKFCANCQFVKT